MAQWLEPQTGDLGVLGSNPAGGSALWNFGNSVYHTLSLSFVLDTKSCLSRLSGVYGRGSKISHTVGKCVTYR